MAKILIYIGGTEDGFDNAAGSEQRYIFALAEMLAYYKHEVHCVGSNHGGNEEPTWGDTIPIPGIKFMHMSSIDLSKRQYDIAIISENLVHWRSPGFAHQTPCIDFDNIATVIAHPLFGWAGSGLPCAMGQTNKKHWVMQPFEPVFPNISRDSDAIIYYPVYKESAPLNLKERDSIIIPCKDPYLDEWKQDMNFHFGCLSVLKAMKKLSNEKDIRCVFVPSKTYNTTRRADRLGITNLFNSISNKKTYETLIRRSILESELKRSRVSIVLQGYFSSAFLAPAMGAVPVYFMNDSGTVWHKKLKLLDMADTDDQLYQVLERFFTDDQFYIDHLQTTDELMSKFSWQSSYYSFEKFMEDKYE